MQEGEKVWLTLASRRMERGGKHRDEFGFLIFKTVC